MSDVDLVSRFFNDYRTVEGELIANGATIEGTHLHPINIHEAEEEFRQFSDVNNIIKTIFPDKSTRPDDIAMTDGNYKLLLKYFVACAQSIYLFEGYTLQILAEMRINELALITQARGIRVGGIRGRNTLKNNYIDVILKSQQQGDIPIIPSFQKNGDYSYLLKLSSKPSRGNMFKITPKGREERIYFPFVPNVAFISAFYLAIIEFVLSESPNKDVTNAIMKLFPTVEENPDDPLDDQKYSAFLALQLKRYPTLADPSINLALIRMVDVVADLKDPASKQAHVVSDYLRRNNIPITGWTSLIQWHGHEDEFRVLQKLYDYVESRVQPGGIESRDAIDRLELQRGTLSTECNAKEYSELQAAAISLLSGATLVNVCAAISTFKERLDLEAPCEEYEVDDLVNVLETLVGVLSKRELCSLIAQLGGRI